MASTLKGFVVLGVTMCGNFALVMRIRPRLMSKTHLNGLGCCSIHCIACFIDGFI